ncbi:unnamed protein product [Haemonchus placei]|uniref:RRM domain-containing protein n=1 Tax=Haemonchus placei TaxID=6290 RepID=A0A158QPB8_HAEPC|nr:unnamed protein product [Haemonchus placei]
MHIENVEEFTSWLIAELTPVCDAEPGTLAKYVLALLRKPNKSDEEMRAFSSSQLEITELLCSSSCLPQFDFIGRIEHSDFQSRFFFTSDFFIQRDVRDVIRDGREPLREPRRRSRSRSPRDRRGRLGARRSPNDRFRGDRRRTRFKGYCMQGDHCVFDHGPDPVVVDDSALEKMVKIPEKPASHNFTIPPPGYHPPNPPPPGVEPIFTGPPPGPRPVEENAPFVSSPKALYLLTVQVKKIPPEFNNIAKLNEHFATFGSIVNMQVRFNGEPDSALISYASRHEAMAAYKSPQPVLNNRFIKVFFYNPDAVAGSTAGQDVRVFVTYGLCVRFFLLF